MNRYIAQIKKRRCLAVVFCQIRLVGPATFSKGAGVFSRRFSSDSFGGSGHLFQGDWLKNYCVVAATVDSNDGLVALGLKLVRAVEAVELNVAVLVGGKLKRGAPGL